VVSLEKAILALMNESALSAAVIAARDCAFAMQENARYVEKELGSVEMPRRLRHQAREACSAFLETAYDVCSELDELDELRARAAPEDEITRRLERILRWLRSPIEQMDDVVTALDAAATRDEAVGAGYILVAESAVNILGAEGIAAEAIGAALSASH